MLPTKPLNSEYLHQYSRELALKLANKFFTDTEIITGEQILEFSTIKQINFLILKVLEERWEAEATRLESPFFDYGAPEVQEGLRTFLNVLSRHIKVQKKAFIAILIEAVYGTLQLVLDPRSFYELEIQKPAKIKVTSEHYRRSIKYIQYNREIFKTFVGELSLKYADTFRAEDALGVWHQTLRDHWRYIEPIEWRIKAFSNMLELDLDAIYTRAVEAEEEEEAKADEKLDPQLENMIREAEMAQTDVEKEAETPRISLEKPEILPAEAENVPAPAVGEEIPTETPEILPTEAEKEPEKEVETPRISLEKPEILPAEEENVPAPFVGEEIPTETPEILPTEAEKEPEKEVETPRISLEKPEILPTEAENVPVPVVGEEIPTETPEISPTEAENVPVVGETKTDETAAFFAHIDEPAQPIIPAQTAKTATQEEDTSINAKYRHQKVANLRDAIPLHEKFTFIDELFGGDNLAFQDALERIDRSPNYEEARRLTNQYLLQFNWDFDRDSTQDFLAWLGKRF